METTLEREAPRETGRRIRVGWALGVLSAVAVASVVVATVAVLSRPSGTGARTARETQAGSLYTTQEEAVMRLVAQGFIPAATLHGEPYRTKNLVNQGLVPRQALDLALQIRPSLYTAEERAVMAAVARGDIPPQTLEGEPFRTKALVNAGLMPWQTLLP